MARHQQQHDPVMATHQQQHEPVITRHQQLCLSICWCVGMFLRHISEHVTSKRVPDCPIGLKQTPLSKLKHCFLWTAYKNKSCSQVRCASFSFKSRLSIYNDLTLTKDDMPHFVWFFVSNPRNGTTFHERAIFWYIYQNTCCAIWYSTSLLFSNRLSIFNGLVSVWTGLGQGARSRQVRVGLEITW